MSRVTQNLTDWYWIVSDSAPGSQVWSTASNAYVSSSAAAFLAWLADGIVDPRIAPGSFGSTFQITTTADNGSGKVRCALPSTSQLATGQRFQFGGAVHTPGLNGTQAITVIDGTHFDVPAVAFVAADTAAVMRGATIIDAQSNLLAVLEPLSRGPAQETSGPSGKSALRFLNGSTASAGAVLQLTAYDILFQDINGHIAQPGSASGVTKNINITTAGPVANGRDQPAAFVAGDEVYLYFILSNLKTIDGIVSKRAPSIGGPTLPLGYSHWCYACSIVLAAGPTVPAVHVSGSWVWYDRAQSVVSGGSATVETSISTGGVLPAVATNLSLLVELEAVATAAGLNEQLIIRHTSGQTFDWVSTFLAASAAQANSISPMLPNTGTFYYLINVIGGSAAFHSANILLKGYECPNGGP